MVAFLKGFVFCITIFNAHSDMPGTAIVEERMCSDKDCCENCRIYQWKFVNLDVCYESSTNAFESVAWEEHTCLQGNHYIYRGFDNSWCGGNPEFTRTSGRCYSSIFGGSYYYECSRYSMADPDKVPSPIGRRAEPLKHSNTHTNQKQESSTYILEVGVIFIVFFCGLFGGYLLYTKRRRKKHQELKLLKKEEILADE